MGRANVVATCVLPQQFWGAWEGELQGCWGVRQQEIPQGHEQPPDTASPPLPTMCRGEQPGSELPTPGLRVGSIPNWLCPLSLPAPPLSPLHNEGAAVTSQGPEDQRVTRAWHTEGTQRPRSTSPFPGLVSRV